MKRLRIRYADWSGAEYGSLIGGLFSGLFSGVFGGPDHGQLLAAEMRALLGCVGVYPVNYAHTGLELALQAFIGAGGGRRKVLVPAYICPIVVKSIAACGLDAVAVDIGDDLNLSPAALARALDDDTLAVVAPHMYGCPARITEIETLCRAAGVFLVDDAAQVTGVQQDRRPLGSFGDVGLVSFGQSKTIVCGIRGAGGVLLVNNTALDAGLAHAWRQLPPPQGRAGSIAEFLWSYQWSRITGNSGERLLDRLQRHGWPRPYAAPLQQAQIGRLDAAVARTQLRRLPAILAAKRRVVEMFHEVFADSAIGFPQYAPGRYLTRVMLALPPGADLGACRQRLAGAGIQTRAGYPVPFAPQPASRQAHAMAARMLGMPCGPDMTLHEIRHLRRQIELAIAGNQINQLNED